MAGSPPTILDFMAALTRWFSGPSWDTWRVFVAALFGLPLTEEQAVIFHRYTGGRVYRVGQMVREAWWVMGRRAGKSLISALIVVFMACFRVYRLAPGERGVVMVLAADRRQARVVFRYIEGFFDAIPGLAKLISRRTRDAIYLKNGIVIEVHTASFRAVRGYTIVAVICDEISFWRDEGSANPDTEILNALRPAMATVPGALLLAISSPYARRGALWDAYSKHFGKDGDPVLVVQAETRMMNPTLDEAVIADAYEQDEAAASAEYGAQFRRDVETFIAREAVEAVVVPERRELPPVAGVGYVGFVDPSGGSADSMTLGIAHREDGRAVLDLVRERRPPFSPESVVAEFAETLKAYGCFTVTGDRYAGEWPRERFAVHGISYETAGQVKSALYGELLPAINSKTVELLDHPRLLAQLLGLERRTARGGRDSIDHGPGGHDDVVNAAAGALVLAGGGGADDLGLCIGDWDGSRHTLMDGDREDR